MTGKFFGFVVPGGFSGSYPEGLIVSYARYAF
jgi:hypothetical protein